MTIAQNRPGTDARTQPHLSALTGVRFLAALHVVLFHFAGPTILHGPVWVHRIVADGPRSVRFFFLLSGFVLAYNYLGSRKLETRDFWVARFARIYPAFILAFLWMGPFYIYHELVTEPSHTALEKIGLSAIVSVTMTQAWTPMTAMTWNGLAWSLSAEAFFYATFPFWASRMRGRTLAWLCGFTALAFALSLIRPLLGSMFHSDTMTRVVFFHPLLYAPVFLIGMALGRAFLVRGPARFGRWMADGGFVAALAVMAFPLRSAVATEALIIAFFAITIYGLGSGKGILAWFCSLPAMVLLGEASYGVYILQLPVAATFLYALRGTRDFWSVPGLSIFPTWPLLLLYTGGLALVSIGSLKFIETPMRRAIRQSLRRRSELVTNPTPASSFQV